MADDTKTLRGPICYGHEQIHPRTNLRRVKNAEQEYEIATSAHGLTKREYFAAMALQGLLSDAASVANIEKSIIPLQQCAVMLADALIDGLNTLSENQMDVLAKLNQEASA